MKKEEILKTIKAVKEASKKRNFKQSFDLAINLKFFDPKKNSIENFITLPMNRGKKLKICAIVDKDLSVNAKTVFDHVILKDDFADWQGNNKKLKKMAVDYDFFVAQANIMPQIATVFGKALGPRGKMPNPKSGAIVPPNLTALKPVYEKLQNTVKVATKNEAVVKCSVGMEDSKDEDIADNVTAVYNNLIPMLPQEEASIKSVVLKLTMGKPFKINAGSKG